MSVKQQQMVKLQFYARKLTDLDFFTKSDPFLSISKKHKVTQAYTRVRKTETINNNLNPDWGFLYMSLQELCDGDIDMKLQVEVFDEDNTSDKLIGATQLSLKDFQDMASSGQPANLIYKNKSRGQLYVKQCVVNQPGTQDKVVITPTAGNWVKQAAPSSGKPPGPYPASAAGSNPYPSAAGNNPYPSSAAGSNPYPSAAAGGVYPPPFPGGPPPPQGVFAAPSPFAGAPPVSPGGGLYPNLSLPYPPYPAAGAPPPPAGPWCPQL